MDTYLLSIALICTCVVLYTGPDKAKHLEKHFSVMLRDELAAIHNGQRVRLLDSSTNMLEDYTVDLVVGGDRAFLCALFGCNHLRHFCPSCGCDASHAPSAGPNHKKAFFTLWCADGATSLR